MPEEFLEEAQARRRISPVRIAVAVAVVAGLLLLSVLYHDGVLGVDDLGEVNADGIPYRVKGRATQVTEAGFVLSGPTGDLPIVWNITTPTPGATYVVNGAYNTSLGGIRAQAVVATYFF